MKWLPVFDDEMKLKADAGQNLTAIYHYPNDSDSRAQLVELLTFEMMREERDGVNHNEPTEFSAVIETSVQNGQSQKAVAGFLTICLLVLRKDGSKPVTKYAASLMSEKILGQIRSKGNHPFFRREMVNGEVFETGLKSASGAGDIRAHFTKFNSIGHLVAAAILMTESTPARPWVEEMNANLPKLLRTVAEFERTVVDSFPEYFPDPWRIAEILPPEMASLAPYDLSPGLQEIFGVESIW